MLCKMDDIEPKRHTEDTTVSVFKEILGHRPGYARGVSEMVILEST